MFKIKLIIIILILFQSQSSLCQSAIGQLENMTGQKINRYNTSNSSGYDMNSMISGMIAQSMINSIFNSNTKNYSTVKEAKVQTTYLTTEIEGEKLRVEQKLTIDKYNRLIKSYKFLNDSSALHYTYFKEKKELTAEQKKATCIKAQKEINRLTKLKADFQKQINELEKWSSNLDGYKKDFIDDRNKNTEGWVDNVLDVVPIEKIKAGAKTVKELSDVKKLEQSLSATKVINASTKMYLDNTRNEGFKDKHLDQILLTNSNFSNTGVLVEELAVLAPTKYQESITQVGKILQIEGSTLKIYDDIADGKKLETKSDYFEAAGKTTQNIISVAGIFCPLVRITAAGEQLVEKAAYAAISDYAIHQMSTSKSQNEKAQEFLKNKMLDIDNKIKILEPDVAEYKKINPAGCPISN